MEILLDEIMVREMRRSVVNCRNFGNACRLHPSALVPCSCASCKKQVLKDSIDGRHPVDRFSQ